MTCQQQLWMIPLVKYICMLNVTSYLCVYVCVFVYMCVGVCICVCVCVCVCMCMRMHACVCVCNDFPISNVHISCITTLDTMNAYHIITMILKLLDSSESTFNSTWYLVSQHTGHYLVNDSIVVL